MQEQKIHKVFPEIIKKYTCAHIQLVPICTACTVWIVSHIQFLQY